MLPPVGCAPLFAILANASDAWKHHTGGPIHAFSFRPMPAPLPVSNTYGRRLREARLARGLSQADLGAVLGLEDQNSAAPRISRYERGERMPGEATMERLAEELGLPVAYFHATSDVLAEVILVVSRLPPERQRELLARVRTYAESLEPSERATKT
ncbi:helix-turn-helix transcriptional regulator [Stenotrophomonas maltophilia]